MNENKVLVTHFKFSGQASKGVLHVHVFLGRGFHHEQDLRYVLAHLTRLFEVHLTLLLQITLVAHQDNQYVGSRVPAHFLDPFLQVGEGRPLCDVINWGQTF